jgi:hypothetical protein
MISREQEDRAWELLKRALPAEGFSLRSEEHAWERLNVIFLWSPSGLPEVLATKGSAPQDPSPIGFSSRVLERAVVEGLKLPDDQAVPKIREALEEQMRRARQRHLEQERELEQLREHTRRARERFDNQPDHDRLFYDTSGEL